MLLKRVTEILPLSQQEKESGREQFVREAGSLPDFPKDPVNNRKPRCWVHKSSGPGHRVRRCRNNAPYGLRTKAATVRLCDTHYREFLDAWRKRDEGDLIAEHAGEPWTLGLSPEEILDELDRRALREVMAKTGAIVKTLPDGTSVVKRRVQ